MNTPTRVLFLCAHNRVRSILAEALLNHLARGRMHAVSAGMDPDPTGQADPFTLDALARAGVSTQGLHSKSWRTFAAPGAPSVDWVVTLCDHTAGELEPVWPGHPASAHWHYPDPSAVVGTDDERHDAYRQTLHLLGHRMELLLALPPDKLAHAFQA